MKRGQTGIALVILGVIAIIAVIGLVLLFTRASKEAQGAVLTDLSIGNTYQGQERGISTPYSTAQYYVSDGGAGAYQRAPAQEVPGYAGNYPNAVVNTRGSRTPAYVISGKFENGARSGYAQISDAYGCEWSLITGAKIPVPHNQFNYYQVPNKGPTTGEVKGYYPPDSSAEARPGKSDLGNQGGDVYAYSNSNGAEGQVPNAEDWVRQNILNAVKVGSANYGAYTWTTTYINGLEVPVCWVSAKTFPFPQ